jgi:hypothetical protein
MGLKLPSSYMAKMDFFMAISAPWPATGGPGRSQRSAGGAWLSLPLCRRPSSQVQSSAAMANGSTQLAPSEADHARQQRAFADAGTVFGKKLTLFSVNKYILLLETEEIIEAHPELLHQDIQPQWMHTVILAFLNPTQISLRDAYRWRSPAAGSGSDIGADAVGSQVQCLVRLLSGFSGSKEHIWLFS